MTRVLERADQLVLDYVSRVADAAHGVLRTDHRLAFVQRVRARIDEERAGREDPRQVAKVIARFGSPEGLVEREARRIAGESDGSADTRHIPAADGARPPDLDDGADRPTAVFPLVADDIPGRGFGSARPSAARTSPSQAVNASPSPTARVSPSSAGRAGPISGSAPGSSPGPWPTPPPMARPAGPAPVGGPLRRRVPPAVGFGERRVVRRTRGVPLARLRRAAMAGANPMATDGRDARTILLENRRETTGILLLVVAALLVPFHLPVLAIFPVPLLVWVVAGLTVLACEGWQLSDRVTGIAAPVLTYAVGGLLLGGARTSGTSFDAFMTSFHRVSGVMFILGTAAGVCWLAYRLLNPPPPPRRPRPLSRPGG
jgi:hypothetical protein